MSVKIKVKNRVFTLSWSEFEQFMLKKPAKISIEIISMG